MKRIWFLDYRPWLLALLTQVPSIRNFYAASSIPNHFLVMFIVFIFVLIGSFLIFNNSKMEEFITRLLCSPIILVVLLLLITGVSFLVYPRIEGLNRGGTGDDAMIQPIIAMVQGKWLYDISLFDSAPISPGLGWLFFNSIFTISGLFWLFNVIYLVAVVLLIILSTKQIWQANLIILYLISSFAFWEQIYSHQDLIAIGCSFVIIFLLLEKQNNNKYLFWIGMLTGIFSTSRIIFLWFPLVLTLIYYRKFPKFILHFSIPSIITAVGIHIIGIIGSKYYQPLHLLFDRGPNKTGIAVIVVGGIFTFLLSWYAFKAGKETFQKRIFWSSVLLIIPLLFIALGELLHSNSIAQWEGARYLLPSLPICLFSIIINEPLFNKHTI